jgi:hypothetical protein
LKGVASPTSLFDIREWNGSQQNAFEELCFQLRDPDPAECPATKTGAPDRGIDWWLIDSSGGRVAHQAKFVEDIDDALPQMRDSLSTALREVSDLVEMTFWVPFDLPEATPRARGGGRKKSARQRWEDAVTGWRKELDGAERLRSIELVPGAKILERLLRDEHRGRLWFFFDRELFSLDWCRAHLRSVRDFVGERYRPDLHVELPVAFPFEGLAATERFLDELGARQRELLTCLQRLDRVPEAIASDTGAREAASTFTQAATRFGWSPDPRRGRLPVDEALRACVPLEAALDATNEKCWALRHEQEPSSDGRPNEELASASRSLSKAHTALAHYQSLLQSTAAQAANTRKLALHGEAGGGKTHLICDVAQRLLARDQLALVLLGGHFESGNVWNLVADELGLERRGHEALLGALDAAAAASGRRFVIFIDALNESPDPRYWRTALEEVRVRVGNREGLAVAVSCRSTYLSVVGLEASDLRWRTIEHRGLYGREDEAATRYFEHYGVQAPRVPLLHPDLTNPLFLKLYCESLQGDLQPSAGSDWASAIFERVIRAHSATVDQRLELDPDDDVTASALRAFSAGMVEVGRAHLPREQARDLFLDVLPTRDRHPRTLLHQLLDVGLLSRDIVREGNGESDVVRFSYNRFSDHGLAADLLARHVDTEDPGTAFKPGGALHLWARAGDRGVMEALTNLVPERFGFELVDALEAVGDRRPFRGWLLRLVLRALPHRDPAAITQRTIELLAEDERLRSGDDSFALLCAMAPDPDHPLGGDRLHRLLARTSTMAARDRAWGRLLEHAAEPYGAMYRLLRWAERGPYADYDPDVIESACTPLVWLLATPNRASRDQATKALTHVLQRHLSVAAALVKRFSPIADGAIQERLAVTCHGAVLRGGWRDCDGARKLFDTMKSCWLEADSAPVDAMVRDALRGTGEWLREHGLIDEQALQAVSPPYVSRALGNPPRRSTLEARYPTVRYDEPGEGYEVLWRAIEGTLGDHMRHTIMPAVERFVRPRYGRREGRLSQDWTARWLFARALSLGWTPVRFGPHDRTFSHGIRGRSEHEGFADKYVAIALRELLARLGDHHTFYESYGDKPEHFSGAWQLNLREVDPTLPPSRLHLDEDGAQVYPPPLPLDDANAWWVGHAVGWEPGDDVATDWGCRTADLPELHECLRPIAPDGTPWVRLDGHTGHVEPQDPTRPEPRSVIAGRDLGFSVQALLVSANDYAAVLTAARAAPPQGNPEAGMGGAAYLGEAPWAAPAGNPDWTWERRAGHSLELPRDVLIASSDWGWSGGSDDASLTGALYRAVPALGLYRAGELVWKGDGAQWHYDGRCVLQARRSGGVYRDIQSGLLADEAWLAQTLLRSGWALVIKLVGEKHLYNATDSRRGGISSWCLFGGAVGFDGHEWNGGDWQVLRYPPGQIVMDDEHDVPERVAARAGDRLMP